MQFLRGKNVALPLILGWALLPVFFIVDLEIPLGYAGGMPYVIPIVLGLWAGSPRHVWLLTIASTLLTFAGFWVSSSAGHDILWTVYVNRFGAVGAIWITSLVVVRQLQTKRVLHRTEARLAAAQHAAQIGSYEWDLAGPHLWLNSEAREVLGIDHQISSPSQLLTHVLPADRAKVERDVRDAVDSGTALALTCRISSGDAAVRVVHIIGKTVADSNRASRLVGTVRDVTREKQLEDELIHSQKMEAIGQLASGIAHDINNVLMGVDGCISVALNKLSDDEPARTYLQEAKQAARAGASITRQLLSFGRKRDQERVDIELDSLVGGSENMLRRLLGEKITLQISLGAHRKYVHSDPGKLQQVVMNLVINARDAMPGGGTLTIATTEVTVGAEQTKLPPGMYLQLCVSDTGSGMDSQTQARVFEPFFTTKELGRGTGLGLSTTYSIVTELDGRIELDSAVGDGTTFRLLFPCSDVSVAQPEQARHVVTRGNGETVLVVEDEPLIRRTIVDYLEHCAYHALAAKDAEEAEQLWQQDPDAINVILTDVVLPGLSGPALAAKLRRQRPGTPVIYMSAYSADVIAQDPNAEHGTPTLHKPFTEEQLTTTLAELLGTRAVAIPPVNDRRTILVVEDNTAARLATTELLSEFGYDVVAAATGAEAERLCREVGEQIGLVVTDLGLPDVSGDELVRDMRTLVSDFGVIYVSGRPREDDLVQRALAEPESIYHQKPVDFDRLMQDVERLL